MKFQVELTELTGTATAIEGKAREYQQLYSQLYQAVDSMQAAWQGKDNLAFTAQIKGFKDDFDRMRQLLMDFAELIRYANAEYRQALNDSTNVAKSIG